MDLTCKEIQNIRHVQALAARMWDTCTDGLTFCTLKPHFAFPTCYFRGIEATRFAFVPCPAPPCPMSGPVSPAKGKRTGGRVCGKGFPGRPTLTFLTFPHGPGRRICHAGNTTCRDGRNYMACSSVYMASKKSCHRDSSGLKQACGHEKRAVVAALRTFAVQR